MMETSIQRKVFYHMCKAEKLILSILGIVRSDVRPIVCAVETMADLLFIRCVPMSSIRVTKHIYPAVAQRLRKRSPAVSRSIERLANLCLEAIFRQDRVFEFFGRPLFDMPSTTELLFYLAFLLHFDKPFFSVLDDANKLDFHA